MLTTEALIVLIVGALPGGLVNGLAGFGSGPVIMGFWLLVLTPNVAAPLLVTCAIVYLLIALRLVWHAVDWRRLLPFAFGAVLGVPLGTLMLMTLSPQALKLFVGILLIVFVLGRMFLLRDLRVEPRTMVPDVGVGATAGLVCAAVGIPGPIWTLWCGIRGWTKSEQRAVYQPLNVVVLLLTLASFTWNGLITTEVLGLAAWCLPAALIGMDLGHPIYRRLDDRQFQHVVLLLLLVMGGMLIANTLINWSQP